MKELTAQITLYDYWHAGSGRSSGPLIDAAIVRTKAGLPYLPGRTLRGLLREGVLMAEESAMELSPGIADELFGGENKDGHLRVSDACLEATLEAWVVSQVSGEIADTLTETIAATAIDSESGVATTGSLRAMEVALPMALHAKLHILEHVDEAQAFQALVAGAAFVRGLGASRRRGLGRARITVSEVSS